MIGQLEPIVMYLGEMQHARCHILDMIPLKAWVEFQNAQPDQSPQVKTPPAITIFIIES